MADDKLGLVDVFSKSFSILFNNPKLFVITLLPLIVGGLVFYFFSLSFGLLSSLFGPAFYEMMASGDLTTITIIELFEPITTAVMSLATPLLVLTLVYVFVLPLVFNAYYLGAKQVLKGEKLKLGKLFSDSFSKLGRFYTACILMLIINLIPSAFTYALAPYSELLIDYIAIIIYAAYIILPLVTLILGLILFYVIPVMVIDNRNFRNSFKYAWYIGKKNFFRTIGYELLLLLVLGLLLLAAFIPYVGMIIYFFIAIPLVPVSHAVLYIKGTKRR